MSKFDDTTGTQVVPAYVGPSVIGNASGMSPTVDLFEYKAAMLFSRIESPATEIISVGLEESDDDSIWTTVPKENIIIQLGTEASNPTYTIILDNDIPETSMGYIGFKRYIRMIYLNGPLFQPFWASFLLSRVADTTKTLPEAV